MAKKQKALSDGEVNDFAFKKLIGDLGGIEAEGIFKEDEEPNLNVGTHSTTVTGPGYSIEIKNNAMDGEQTKEKPEIEDEPEEDRKFSKLGK